MANIKNIKDKDGIVYPVTKGDAVSMESGDTLQSELDKKLETVTTNDIQDGAVTSSKIGAGQVTSQNIDWATFKNIQWTNGTFASGFGEASNTGFSGYGIRAAILGGFLVVQIGVSKTDGTGFGTGNTVGYIPSVVNGIQVNSIATITNHKIIRGFASGTGGAAGSIQLDGTAISVTTYDNTNKWAWVFGEIIIPLNN